jgi:hypothetical protein
MSSCQEIFRAVGRSIATAYSGLQDVLLPLNIQAPGQERGCRNPEFLKIGAARQVYVP